MGTNEGTVWWTLLYLCDEGAVRAFMALDGLTVVVYEMVSFLLLRTSLLNLLGFVSSFVWPFIGFILLW